MVFMMMSRAANTFVVDKNVVCTVMLVMVLVSMLMGMWCVVMFMMMVMTWAVKVFMVMMFGTMVMEVLVRRQCRLMLTNWGA